MFVIDLKLPHSVLDMPSFKGSELYSYVCVWLFVHEIVLKLHVKEHSSFLLIACLY